MGTPNPELLAGIANIGQTLASQRAGRESERSNKVREGIAQQGADTEKARASAALIQAQIQTKLAEQTVQNQQQANALATAAQVQSTQNDALRFNAENNQVLFKGVQEGKISQEDAMSQLRTEYTELKADPEADQRRVALLENDMLRMRNAGIRYSVKFPGSQFALLADSAQDVIEAQRNFGVDSVRAQQAKALYANTLNSLNLEKATVVANVQNMMQESAFLNGNSPAIIEFVNQSMNDVQIAQGGVESSFSTPSVTPTTPAQGPQPSPQPSPQAPSQAPAPQPQPQGGTPLPPGETIGFQPFFTPTLPGQGATANLDLSPATPPPAVISAYENAQRSLVDAKNSQDRQFNKRIRDFMKKTEAEHPDIKKHVLDTKVDASFNAAIEKLKQQFPERFGIDKFEK